MTHLAVFSHKHFRRTPRGMETTGAFTVQIDVLASHFDEVTLCVPVSEAPGFTGVGLAADNVSFHPVPLYRGRLDFARKIPSLRRAVLTTAQRTDLGLAIVPGYLGVLASAVCQRRGFPLFQWVVSDWSDSVLARRTDPLARWLIRTLACPMIDMVMTRLTRDVLTFYTGQVLYHLGEPHQHARVSSSIRQSDLSPAKGTSRLTSPVDLLFVGRLSEEKGLSYLLEAVALLRQTKIAVQLHLVGSGALQTELHGKARALALGDQVLFHGFVPHGERLFEHYRNSDILVLPSLQEQQGKVLLEAMALGLPVVATQVGGIPTVVAQDETGLLVPPADPSAIADAVKRLVADTALRDRLIQAGVEYATAHTVDAETERMMQIIVQHFEGTVEGVV